MVRRRAVGGAGGRRVARGGVTTRFRRAIVVVCDGLGVGAAADAAAYGDEGSDTLGHVLASRPVRIPTLHGLGIGNLTPSYAGCRNPRPLGAFGKMAERSAGKDTATGHWEIAGLVTEQAFRTYPTGFPPDLIETFEARIGRKVLGNKAASGTEILKELGAEHLRTGRPIVYTSQDSVFQVAAHEDVLPPAALYEMCRAAYDVACLGHGVCRVIARPFVGCPAAGFKRTTGRRDFPVPPPGDTLLDRFAAQGLPVVGIGKIPDIFTGRGLSESVHTRDDFHGIDETLAAMERVGEGLIFTNLVDFDTLYGHRNDVSGYAAHLELVDARLAQVLAKAQPEDIFALTGDHGCDPSDTSTDHTRENVPLLVQGRGVRAGVDLGTRSTFADLGATLAECFGLPPLESGSSFLAALRGHGASV
jgi:phosphopentomutase